MMNCMKAINHYILMNCNNGTNKGKLVLNDFGVGFIMSVVGPMNVINVD